MMRRTTYRPESLMQARRAFDKTNRQAAEIILGDVSKHGGEQSGAVQWARTFLARRPAPAGPSPLFEADGRKER